MSTNRFAFETSPTIAMFLRVCQFVTLVLAALLMATGFGHLLEMPATMNVPGPLWLTFQQTLYPAFAVVGEPIELAAIVATAVLAFLMRKHKGWFGLTLTAAILLTISFAGIWYGLVTPVNAKTASWTAGSMPSDWQRWRTQWECSQAVRFILQFSAFYALAASMLIHRPAVRSVTMEQYRPFREGSIRRLGRVVRRAG
jgi:hypothetical protein